MFSEVFLPLSASAADIPSMVDPEPLVPAALAASLTPRLFANLVVFFSPVVYVKYIYKGPPRKQLVPVPKI